MKLRLEVVSEVPWLDEWWLSNVNSGFLEWRILKVNYEVFINRCFFNTTMNDEFYPPVSVFFFPVSY